MTASPGREVQSNRVSSVLSSQLLAEAQDAGREDLGDLVEALGRGHQVGVEWDRHGPENGKADEQLSFAYIRRRSGNCRVAFDLAAGILIFDLQAWTALADKP
jgi:hypothetical protein